MGTHLERVQAFADEAFAVASLGDLDLLIQETARQLGADYFLMIHHANFAASAPGPGATTRYDVAARVASRGARYHSGVRWVPAVVHRGYVPSKRNSSVARRIAASAV